MVDLSIQRGFLLSALLLILSSYVSIDFVVFGVYPHPVFVRCVFVVSDVENGRNEPFFPFYGQ